MNVYSQQLLETMRTRFACKEFMPGQGVSDEDFTLILEAGRLAPSSFGFEPWQFLSIENNILRDKIATVTWGVQRQMPGLNRFVIILARKPEGMLSDNGYLKHLMEQTQHMSAELASERFEKFKRYMAEDMALTGNERAGFEWASRQCYLALENMLLMAACLGVDSCPIEGFHKENLETLLEKEGLLDCKNFGVACLAVFGLRTEDPKRSKTRRPMSEVLRVVE